MAFDEDFMLAQQLQEQFDNEYVAEHSQTALASNPQSGRSSVMRYTSDTMSVIDPQWELIDPNPDARAMFLEFNDKYFNGTLAGVEVRWSPRMTLCAGVCCYEGRGGLCSIRLSEPLLKLRPRKDLVETLLHEMIHAYLFVTQNNKDRDGHGPEFCKHMDRINKASGSHITIYHSFHDEVDNYRQHWWRCDGPCQKTRPYFGYVKRAMNRAPSPRDPWWPDHQRTCGGTYHKIKEPEGYGEKKSQKKSAKQDKVIEKKVTGKQDIRDLFNKKDNSTGSSSATSSATSDHSSSQPKLPSLSSSQNITGFNDTETKPQSLFTGSGKSLGGSGPSERSHVIVRKIPGIGVIESRLPSHGNSDSQHIAATTSSADDNTKETYQGDLAAFRNDLDSEKNSGEDFEHNRLHYDEAQSVHHSVTKPKRKLAECESEDQEVVKKRMKQVSVKDLFTSPRAANKPVGSLVKLPGFTSVCNKKTSSHDDGSMARDRNKRAHCLSSSDDSDEDRPLSSAIVKPPVTHAPPSPGVAHHEQVSVAPDHVSCPVCQTSLPSSHINAHLDSCLS